MKKARKKKCVSGRKSSRPTTPATLRNIVDAPPEITG
jgi:hypothetical protein